MSRSKQSGDTAQMQVSHVGENEFFDRQLSVCILKLLGRLAFSPLIICFSFALYLT